jgi:ubiquinone/menaquinone biosynthesis C-methylase UbiE
MKKNRVKIFYDTHAEHEWQRLERHRTEFAVTMKVFEEFLPPPPLQILDIGGGPGRYAIALSANGYQVTLLDLAEGNLQLARQKSLECGVQLETILQGNALDLNTIVDNAYDAVLLMGPLYHLHRTQDRITAIREAKRVLKHGGLIFATFITRYAPFRDYAANDPQAVYAERGQWDQMLKDGLNFGEGFPDANFSLPGEDIPLVESEGFKTLQVLGVEGIAAGHEEKLNLLQGDAWDYWVNLNYVFAKDPDLHAAADHLLIIDKKPD